MRETERESKVSLSHLGDKNAVAFQQCLFILAATQELPDFSSQGLRDSRSYQRRQAFRTSRQVPMPDGHDTHRHTYFPSVMQANTSQKKERFLINRF